LGQPEIPETTPDNARQRHAIDFENGAFTMAVNSHARGAMSRTRFQTLIDYYLGDMGRRGCTNDSITTNRRTLERFVRFVSPQNEDGNVNLVLDEVTVKLVEAYLDQLYSCKVRWRSHPHRDPQPGKLSPFTIRKEIRILKGFGTWLNQEDFENPFADLVVPKEPKRLVKILSDKEIEMIIASINPGTPTGSRLYAIVLFLLTLDQGSAKSPRQGSLTWTSNPGTYASLGKATRSELCPSAAAQERHFFNTSIYIDPLPCFQNTTNFFYLWTAYQ
jgi:hypothetical protein